MQALKLIPTLLADWANGIFAVLIVSWLLGADPLWWHFLIGIFLSHTPDIDAVPELWRRGKVGASAEHPEDYRSKLHYPIPVLGVLSLLIWADPYWGSVWFIVVALHYLNDFYGTGWGLQLMWPFSNKNYKLLGRRVNRLEYILKERGEWDNIHQDERRLRAVVSWNREELPRYYLRWGLSDWERWYYYRFNWVMATEYALFAIALLLMLVTLI